MMKPANGQNRVQRHPAEYKVVILDLSRRGGRCGCRRKNSYKRATGGITTDQSPYSALNQSHLLLNISSKMEMMAPSMCTDILISQFFNIFFLLKKNYFNPFIGLLFRFLLASRLLCSAAGNKSAGLLFFPSDFRAQG